MSAMSPNQFGFRHKTSTCDALHIVQELVLEAMEGGEVVIGASLDVTNAFNSLRWSSIRRALLDKGFPVYLRRIIGSYLSDRKIEYPTSDGNTVDRDITAGVPQGSVLGPTLWNITYDWVLRTPLEEGSIIVGYADDILILTKAGSIDMATARINLQISSFETNNESRLKNSRTKDWRHYL